MLFSGQNRSELFRLCSAFNFSLNKLGFVVESSILVAWNKNQVELLCSVFKINLGRLRNLTLEFVDFSCGDTSKAKTLALLNNMFALRLKCVLLK